VLPVYVNRAFEQSQFGAATAATLVAGIATILIIVIVNLLSAVAIRRLVAPVERT